MTMNRGNKQRRKDCSRMAMQRAQRARQAGLNPVFVLLLFIWALLSATFGRPIILGSTFPQKGRQTSQEDWPVTDYERGHPGPFRQRRSPNVGRYRVQPSFQRLMSDLRRPAARADAAAALALRIPDPTVRAWAAERIDKEEIDRLAIWVRPGHSEEGILAAWQDEAETALAEEATSGSGTDTAPDRADMLRVARLLEALAGVETTTASGPGRPGDS